MTALTAATRAPASASDRTLDPAIALLGIGRPDLALPLLRGATAVDGASPATWLNRALAERAAGDAAQADAILDALTDALPAWEEPHLRRAEAHRAAGRMDAAEAAYNQTLARAPDRLEALIALGSLLVASGRGMEAVPKLQRAVTLAPDNVEAWDALGLALLQIDETEAARAAVTEARQRAPLDVAIALHAAEAEFASGRDAAEAALAQAESASAKDPTNGAVLAMRGLLLTRLGRSAEAADVLEAACALGADTAPVLGLLGTVLASLDRMGAAEPVLRRALALAPDDPGINVALPTVLLRLHRHAEAASLLEAADERLGEDNVRAANRAAITLQLGEQAEAEIFARRAIALAPDSASGWRALCNVLPYRSGVTQSDMLSAARACAAAAKRADAAAPVFASVADPDRRLRLGLLSGGLRTHPVGWLTIAGLEALDPAAFGVVAFAERTSLGLQDPIARRFRVLAEAWHVTDGHSDAAVAELVRASGVDILLELGGHGEAGRLGVCAERAAPVQIKWVGSQTHSTGVAEMDWFITDRWESPLGAEAGFSERLLRLDDGYVCYAPPPGAPAVGALPALARGHVTFGCLNNLEKMTQETLDAWGAILCRVPNARLLLKTHQFGDPALVRGVANALARRGVDPARISCRGASSHHLHVATYAGIDVALDPFPYAGGLTTCEALWMGVPTVTLAGALFSGRHSTSHLSNVGLTDWVAQDIDQYVDRAVEAARDLAALDLLRASLRDRVRTSPLCDASRFGRSLGSALRHAWRDWCAAR